MRKNTDSMDTIPSAEEFIDEMDRTRRADRRRRLFHGLLFWIAAAALAGLIADVLGYIALGIGLVVLLLGLAVMIIREVLAARRYQLPDEAYED